MNSELENKKNDLISSAGKSIAGIIPFAGPLLSELIHHLIPNQRIDRLVSYVKELEARLSQVEESVVRNALATPSGLALAEDGYIAASRAITNERMAYIASLVARGLTESEIDTNRQRYLLNLLAELNDEEILWLRYYLAPEIDGDEEFRDLHRDVLAPVRSYIGAPQSQIDRAAIQASYKEHLERLGLIEGIIAIDRKTGAPEFERISGQPKISYRHITNLGELLLREIGLSDI